MRRLLLLLLAIVPLTALLFALRGLSPQSADSVEISGFVQRNVPVWYLRWPLTHLAAQGLHALLGWPGGDCLALLSSIAGALFLITVALVARRSPLVMIVLASSVTLTLIGHVEVYAFPLLALLLILLLGPLHLEGQIRMAPLAAIWTLGSLFHMLVVFYAPAMLWLALIGRRRAIARGEARAALDRDMQATLSISLAFFLLITLAPLVMPIGGLDNDLERLVPLTMPEVPRSSNQVTLFSPAHLGQVAIFLMISCPVGLPLALMRLHRLWSTDALRFHTLAAACGLGFLLLWHADMGWRGDWDLFSHPGLVINLLAWRLWERNPQIAPMAQIAGGTVRSAGTREMAPRSSEAAQPPAPRPSGS